MSDVSVIFWPMSSALPPEGGSEEVLERLADREPLDPLSAPLGTDLRTRLAPHLFRVGLEKQDVQLAAESTDEKLFQVFRMLGAEEGGPAVAEGDSRHAGQSQLGHRVDVQSQGVVEKLSQEVNSALAPAHEHDVIGCGGIGTSLLGRHATGASLVGDRRVGGEPLQGHALQPPIHHAIGFGEEAVAAEVDAVSLVVDGPREPSHRVAHFQHDRSDAGPLQQLVGRRQSGRPRANDDRLLLAHSVGLPHESSFFSNRLHHEWADLRSGPYYRPPRRRSASVPRQRSSKSDFVFGSARRGRGGKQAAFRVESEPPPGYNTVATAWGVLAGFPSSVPGPAVRAGSSS